MSHVIELLLLLARVAPEMLTAAPPVWSYNPSASEPPSVTASLNCTMKLASPERLGCPAFKTVLVTVDATSLSVTSTVSELSAKPEALAVNVTV